MTSVAVLSAVAFVLAFFEFPVPLSPSFARMDLSDFPALIGAFAFGPIAGILIELVKNLLGLFSTATSGVGELANFLMGASFVATAGLIYKLHKTKKMALIGGIIGSVVMGIVAALANYFILLPLFEQFMPLDQVIASFGAFIPFIKTKLDVVLYNAFPFNLLKGLVITGFTMLVYKRIRPLLKGKE
ncbi:MAG: ECF transporter S component [Oscillospiraceae bacterium]|nr:ECF transporter S component [Oscillospiraceae bacterium]